MSRYLRCTAIFLAVSASPVAISDDFLSVALPLRAAAFGTGSSDVQPLECEEIARRASHLRKMRQAIDSLGSQQRDAVANNNIDRASTLAAERGRLMLKAGLSQNALSALGHQDVTASMILAPFEHTAVFITRSVGLQGRTLAGANARALRLAQLRSVVPFAVRTSRDWRGPTKFDDEIVPARDSWQFAGAYPRDDRTDPLALVLINAPEVQIIRPGLDMRPAMVEPSYARVTMSMRQGHFCDSSEANRRGMARFRISYAPPIVDEGVISIDYRVGFHVEEATEDKPARIEGERRILDRLLRRILEAVLHPQQIYRVSDELLSAYDGGIDFTLRSPNPGEPTVFMPKNKYDLRAALARAYDKLVAAGDAPTVAMLTDHLNSHKGFTDVPLGGSVTTVYANGNARSTLGVQNPGSVLFEYVRGQSLYQLVFTPVAGRPKITMVVANGEVLYQYKVTDSASLGFRFDTNAPPVDLGAILRDLRQRPAPLPGPFPNPGPLRQNIQRSGPP